MKCPVTRRVLDARSQKLTFSASRKGARAPNRAAIEETTRELLELMGPAFDLSCSRSKASKLSDADRANLATLRREYSGILKGVHTGDAVKLTIAVEWVNRWRAVLAKILPPEPLQLELKRAQREFVFRDLALIDRYRRCKAKTKSGPRCMNMAQRGNNKQFCNIHLRPASQKQKRPVCNCIAYQWPHRRGGGLCQWPKQPLQICMTPAGTHRARDVTGLMTRTSGGVSIG